MSYQEIVKDAGKSNVFSFKFVVRLVAYYYSNASNYLSRG